MSQTSERGRAYVNRYQRDRNDGSARLAYNHRRWWSEEDENMVLRREELGLTEGELAGILGRTIAGVRTIQGVVSAWGSREERRKAFESSGGFIASAL